MKQRFVKQRFIREESGFTLSEVLVTMMVMIVVLFALYSIFDMSIRVFSFGNNKVEAVENARLGLEKMEREIRAAYPYDKGNIDGAGIDSHLLDTMARSEITFGNDATTVNYKVDANEVIRYRLEDNSPGDGEVVCNSGDTCRLGRSVGGGAFEPVVEFVRAPDPSASPAYEGGLKLTYLKEDGPDAGTALDEITPLATPSSAEEPNVKAVRIELDVVVNEGSQTEGNQTLTTEVALRSRVE